MRNSSTLVASPLITKPHGSSKTRDKEYLGKYCYDENWEAFCVSLGGARGRLSASVVRAMTGVTTSRAITEDAYVRLCAIGSLDTTTVRASYQKAVAILSNKAYEEEDDKVMGEDDTTTPTGKRGICLTDRGLSFPSWVWNLLERTRVNYHVSYCR